MPKKHTDVGEFPYNFREKFSPQFSRICFGVPKVDALQIISIHSYTFQHPQKMDAASSNPLKSLRSVSAINASRPAPAPCGDQASMALLFRPAGFSSSATGRFPPDHPKPPPATSGKCMRFGKGNRDG